MLEAQQLRLDVFADVVREQARGGTIEQQIAADILAELEQLLAELEAFGANLDALGRVGWEPQDPLDMFEDATNPWNALKLFYRGLQELGHVLAQDSEEAQLDQEVRQGMDWNHDGCKGSTKDGCKPFDEDDEQVERYPRSTTSVKRKRGIIMVDIPGDWWDPATVAEAFDPSGAVDRMGEAVRQDGGLETIGFVGDMVGDVRVLNEYIEAVR